MQLYIFKLLSFKLAYIYNVLRSVFVKDKQLKRRFKNLVRYKLAKRLVDKLKWGVSYSVFDGYELLEKSIQTIKPNADYINVVYQKESWYGEKCSKELMPMLRKLLDKGLIDELIEYKCDIRLPAGKQELIKRNLGLKSAIKNNCDYFMPMDVDEFYDVAELHKAKIKICQNSITNSYCFQLRYLNPTIQLLNTKSSAVMLWSKINKFSMLKKNKSLVTLVDPTRQVSRIFNRKDYVFTDVFMHHYSLFRKDLKCKFRNSSFQGNFTSTNLMCEVDDYFNLDSL